ncbi:trehalase family glycosidase [Salinithrix halophila]|uniref:Trehalase family glycosidase n=1 Tax=Salinithrix halophila TaxID=1485204 RepID=A0ABV8JAY0_9BACL
MNELLPPVRIECPDREVRRTLEYIDRFWRKIVKKSPPYTQGELFYLPYPYVVPGGMFQQLFYWDSYFIILGLKIFQFHRLAKGIVENFFYEMTRFGIIPNSSELAHLSRSQPPFLTSMIRAVWDRDMEWLKKAFEIAKIEYHEVWMNPRTHYHADTGLNKYYDNLPGMLSVKGEAYLHLDEVYIPPRFWQERIEAESGWDYTGRFNRQCGYYLPVDLNALLYKYETDFLHFSKILGHENEGQQWKERALLRKQRIDRYLWNDQEGTYFDYDFVRQRQNRYHSLAAFSPLWSKAASPYQAQRIAQRLPMFLYPGGVVTSTVRSGFQWDYPNGWAPLQWVVAKGLQNYRYEKESRIITERWVRLCTKMFLQHGKLFEKYNVVDFNIQTAGRYPLQEGFGWTNAIYTKFAVEFLGCRIDKKAPID